MGDLPKMPNHDQLMTIEQEMIALPPHDVVRPIHLDQASTCVTNVKASSDHTLKAKGPQSSLRSWERVGTFAHAKRAALVSALQDCDYNVAATATRLEIGRSTIYRLFEEYCIKPSVMRASVVLEDGGPICRVIVDQPPNVRSRLLFEGGKLKLVELAVRN